MSLDILQLRDLLSLRPISIICLKGQEMPQDLHQPTGIDLIWKDFEIRISIGSNRKLMIAIDQYQANVQAGSKTEHMS